MKTKTYITLFLLIFTLAFTGDKSKSTYTIPIKARCIAAGDIDLDGDNDIIVGHDVLSEHNNPVISVLNNNENGLFSIVDTSFKWYGYQRNIILTKINNDEYLDIVVFRTDFSSDIKHYIRVVYNDNGDFNSFNDFPILSNSEPVLGMTYGDVNGDGFNDILMVGQNCQCWGILYNDGQGNFSEPEYYEILDCYPHAIVCGDLNGDGRNDIIVSGFYTNIYYNYADGFDMQELDDPPGTTEISITDFDMDGDQDILIFSHVVIRMFENMANETFELRESVNVYPGKIDFFVSDLNNDGFKDVVAVCGNLSGLNIYYNQGGFVLSEEQFIPVATTDPQEITRKIYCEDMDGNGYQDIIVTKRIDQVVENNLEILFNHGDGNFLPNPVSIINNQQKLQHSFSVYPNPVKQKATFEINTPKAAQIEIIIYDLKGKTVQLFPFEKGAGLRYIDVNVEGMPSGVYYYSLFIDNQYIDTKKMLILK